MEFDEIEVKPEVLQHVAQVGGLLLVIEDGGVAVVQHRVKAIRHLAGLLEARILEVRVEFEFVFHVQPSNILRIFHSSSA